MPEGIRVEGIFQKRIGPSERLPLTGHQSRKIRPSPLHEHTAERVIKRRMQFAAAVRDTLDERRARGVDGPRQPPAALLLLERSIPGRATVLVVRASFADMLPPSR